MGVARVIKDTLKPLVRQIPLARSYQLRAGERRWQKTEHRVDTPVDTPLGFKLVDNRKMQKGLHEPEETEIVKRLLGGIDVSVNIGAHIGYYCCIALSRGLPTIAFEPNYGNLQCLYANMKANHWDDRIEVFPIALSNRIGVVELYGGNTGASLVRGWANTPDRCRSLVSVSTLDNVLASRLAGRRCLFLVDVEGAEYAMLQGAAYHLALEPKPVWLVEICVAEHQPKGIAINPNLLATFQIFWDNGYDAWTATAQQRLITKEEIQAICETGRDTLMTHNFLFLEKKQ